MTFQIRDLEIAISINSGEYTDTITLTGHRVEATILNVGGGANLGDMQLRIFGMRESDMNVISTDGQVGVSIRNDAISLSAIENGVKKQVFSGGIFNAYVDYASAPDVSMIIFASVAGLALAKPAAAKSFKGSVKVSDIISALAGQMGYSFVNNGVTTSVQNQNLSGTLKDQLEAIVQIAKINCETYNDTITIWPNGVASNNSYVTISPENGLVGYPTFNQVGVTINVQFDPDIRLGSKVKLETSITRMNGDYYVQTVSHRLATVTPDGPWFSTIELTTGAYYVSAI